MMSVSRYSELGSTSVMRLPVHDGMRRLTKGTHNPDEMPRILTYDNILHLPTGNETLVAVQVFVFFFQAEDGIRDHCVTGVQTCALPILLIPLTLFNIVSGINRSQAKRMS